MQKITQIIISLLVILAATSVMLLVTPNPARLFAEEHSNYGFFHNVFHQCRQFPIPESTKKVVLRLDDVQAFAYPEITRRMIDDVLNREAHMTLAVIPFDLKEDSDIVRFLKDRSCNLEFALHGWDHSDNPPEFELLSYQEAGERITSGLEMMKFITDKKITTFIPPQNLYSDGTVKALFDVGINTISSEGDGKYDYTATTYDFGKDKLNTAEFVVSECNKVFVNDPLCIIMIHPQDYLTDDKIDEEKYKQYIEMIDTLKNKGVVFTTVANEARNNSNPDGNNL